MMIAAVALLLTQTTLTAADFYPNEVGTTWTYEIVGQGAVRVVDKVELAIELKGEPVVSITSFKQSRKLQTQNLLITPTSVYLHSYRLDSPLETKIPVFVWEGKDTAFSFQGRSDNAAAADFLSIKGVAKLRPNRSVLGQSVPVLEVSTVSVLGNGQYSSTLKHTALYAKGIGLFDLKSDSTVGKFKSSSSMKLLSFEAP